MKKPPHLMTEVSLAYLQRDLKKYQYHTNLLERRRTRIYRIYRKEKPPIEVESDSEYSDCGYSTAEDLSIYPIGINLQEVLIEFHIQTNLDLNQIVRRHNLRRSLR